jgi:hypothetical protein
LLVGGREHEPRETLGIEVVIVIVWRTFDPGDERMRIVVFIIIVVSIAESIEERVEPALLGSGFFRGVDATAWHGREDKLVVDEVWC